MKNILKNNLLLYFIFLPVIYFVACTRTADVEVPPHHPVLVLHGYIAVGDTFKISLGKTFGLNASAVDSLTYVKNGWAVLYENETAIDSLKYNEHQKKYIAQNTIAIAAKTYKIKAGAPGYVAVVEATAVAPIPVNTTSLVNIINARSTSDGLLLNDIKFSFLDPAPIKNYYLAALHPALGGDVCVYTFEPVIERYTGDGVPTDINSCIGGRELLFTDKSFNGNTKEITISAPAQVLEPFTNPSTGAVHRSYLKRYNVSEDYYRYFKSRLTLSYNSGGITLSDPVSVKGNVKNGYGLFTVFTVTTDSLP